MQTTRRALVTGAARGVGLATCIALRELGLEVVGTDIAPIPEGVADTTVLADLASPVDCERILAAAGAVDVLVTAAGLLVPRSIEATSIEDFDLAVNVNLRSVFQLCQGVAPGMSARGWGRIVNFSSVVARTGGTASCAYTAAKAGVLGLTKAFAKQYARAGVTVNSIAPAAIDTELNSFLTPEARARLENDIPVGRFSTPEEFAALVAFLASDSAGYITGATIDMNGGWAMI